MPTIKRGCSTLSYLLSYPLSSISNAHLSERHNNAKSTGCPEHTNPAEEEGSNHEEEEESPMARTPTATFHTTVSFSLIEKHKGRIKQNATVSH